MVQIITVTGKITVGGAATEITLANCLVIKSIISGELIVNSHLHAATSVVSNLTTPALAHAGAAVADHSTGALLDLVAVHTVTQPNTHAAGGVIAGDTCASHQHAAAKAAEAALTVVTVTPTANKEIQRTDYDKFKPFLTTGLTVDDILVLTIEDKGGVVRP